MKSMIYRGYSLYNLGDIPQMAAVPAEVRRAIEVVGRVLPFKTNNYITDRLIDWNRVPDDPVFTLAFPRRQMLAPDDYSLVERLVESGVPASGLDAAVGRIRGALNPNPAGQEHNVPMFDGAPLEGVQHKYDNTVLVFPSQGQTCHAYCTFCFRWPQFSGSSAHRFSMRDRESLHRYLLSRREVTDVLFTGGDPMTMSASLLSRWIDPLLASDFDHIRTVRIGTRALASWPCRFVSDPDSDDMIRLFERVVAAGKNLALQAHFSHPVELSTDVVCEAIRRIRSTGAQIRTQSPVLRHVNASPDLWAAMWRRQVDLGCIPYYMFVVRDTGARRFFELPLVVAWDIFRRAYRSVSGICRTVRGPVMSHTPGKILLHGVSSVQGRRVLVLSFLQARNPDRVGVPFFARYDPEATWFDQLKIIDPSQGTGS